MTKNCVERPELSEHHLGAPSHEKKNTAIYSYLFHSDLLGGTLPDFYFKVDKSFC